MRKLILASKSPRRKDLLEQVGIPLKIVPSNVDEKKITLDAPTTYAKHLCHLKTQSVAKNFPNDWVLGADTIVVVQDNILGKPQSNDHAFEMLCQLNNREHTVYTAFSLSNKTLGIGTTQCVGTKVQFKPCSEDELRWYIQTKEPFGKAGGYAIQGRGTFLVKSISGSYSNVVGLPVCEVIEQMKQLNLIEF